MDPGWCRRRTTAFTFLQAGADEVILPPVPVRRCSPDSRCPWLSRIVESRRRPHDYQFLNLLVILRPFLVPADRIYQGQDKER